MEFYKGNSSDHQLTVLSRPQKNLKDFQPYPEETNDVGRFRRAIEATPVDGELIVPDGYYFADSLDICKNISLVFQGNATIEATTPDRDILRIVGTRDQHNYVLAKPVKRGDRTLHFTETPCFVPGDVIILTDDTKRHGDQQADMNTEIHEVEHVINHHPNLITMNMTKDSIGYGVADGLTAYSNVQKNGIFSIDPVELMQKISLSALSIGSYAGVKQSISVTANRVYTLQMEMRLQQVIGNLAGICYLIWYRADRTRIKKQILTECVSQDSTPLLFRNVRAPEQATHCEIHVEVSTETSGSSGTVCFRDPIFQEASTCIVLRDFVRLPKQISQSGINLYRIHPLEDIVVKNFRFVMKEGSNRGNGLVLHYARGVLLEGIYGYRSIGSGVQVQKSMHVTVKNFRFVKPQKTGSGQGYGVQFYGGCSGILVKDGYTKDCRHAVDLDSTYDAYIVNVMDYNSQGAAFVMSHNGCCSDITFNNCQTLHSIGSGFVADSQGFADPLQCTFYNFNIIGCTAVIQNVATAAVYWYSPCQNSIVRDCNLRFSPDPTRSCDLSQLGNAGIRVYPVRTDLLVSGCTISGFRRGISLQVAGKIQGNNDHSVITIRDTIITHCQSAFLFHQGKSRRLILKNIQCQHITKQLFEFNGKTSFQELAIDGLSLHDSHSCRFINVGGKFHICSTSSMLQGFINNIHSDRERIKLSSPYWEISSTHLYLMSDGNSLHLQGAGGISTADPLPDGLVAGQKLTLVTTNGKWIIRQGNNMMFNRNVREIVLNHERRTASFTWHDNKWIEL